MWLRALMSCISVAGLTFERRSETYALIGWLGNLQPLMHWIREIWFLKKPAATEREMNLEIFLRYVSRVFLLIVPTMRWEYCQKRLLWMSEKRLESFSASRGGILRKAAIMKKQVWNKMPNVLRSVTAVCLPPTTILRGLETVAKSWKLSNTFVGMFGTWVASLWHQIVGVRTAPVFPRRGSSG